jgi:hypothetical protein
MSLTKAVLDALTSDKSTPRNNSAHGVPTFVVGRAIIAFTAPTSPTYAL